MTNDKIDKDDRFVIHAPMYKDFFKKYSETLFQDEKWTGVMVYQKKYIRV